MVIKVKLVIWLVFHGLVSIKLQALSKVHTVRLPVSLLVEQHMCQPSKM